MSRSDLRWGASEGESDALLGKGSGSHSQFRGIVRRFEIRARLCEFTQQAGALEAVDANRQDLSDDRFRGHDMRRLKVSGSAHDLARITGCALEQHIDRGPNQGLVEGR